MRTVWGHVTTYLIGGELWHATPTDQSDDVRLTEHLGKAYASCEVWRNVSLRNFGFPSVSGFHIP